MDKIINTINETRIIAILRGIPSEQLCDVLDAIYDGGIRLAEITFDSTRTVSDLDTIKNIERAIEHVGNKMYIGAGTVVSEEQLKLAAHAGCKFIISPNTDTAIIKATKLLGLVSIPGAMTLSEIVSATQAGADFVKLFPASSLGPEFIRQALAPLGNARLLAVSGVTPEMIPEYLAAGCVGFGIGSPIANRSLCESGQIDKIRENAQRYVSAINAASALK
ncbi:MAG: bifunctional 4-hydroxy-2-oxoglutarate aldolase/2-dehydro-3-deoxy-phosphogluconate aldolase [Clostridiales bacterium]|nr:bifunctional 4-hydroxy-2-oxoglutarate aldolase/2-dehydro-3-deoxy-phosphogluconate aldolase [Clostridiales bacterium]